MPQGNHSPIIFFDGICNLCNHFIDFVIKRDKSNYFYFSPLQSNYAQKILPKKLLTTCEKQMYKSIIYYKNGVFYEQSTAAIMILADLHGYWKFIKIFYFIPKLFRDFIYKIIARKRYHWFGKNSSCRLPTPAEQAKFIL